MNENLASLLSKERERLTRQREDAIARRKAIEEEIANIEKELIAVDAYEAAKSGKLPKVGKRGTRAPRGQRKQQVLDLLAKHPAGLTRGDILEKLGAKGNQSEEQRFSNALHSLKNEKKVTSKDGKYHAKK